MRCTFRSSIATALAAAMALSTLALAPAGAAAAGPQIKAPTTLDLSARRRHHRYNGNNAAALRMFGMMMGTIAGLAARDRYRDGYYAYYGGPYYNRPYYGGYSYGPVYRYRGGHSWHHRGYGHSSHRRHH